MIETIAFLVGIGTLVGFFQTFFADWEDFANSIYYAVRPDFYSWLQGDFAEDFWAEMKLTAWLACGMAGAFISGWILKLVFGL